MERINRAKLASIAALTGVAIGSASAPVNQESNCTDKPRFSYGNVSAICKTDEGFKVVTRDGRHEMIVPGVTSPYQIYAIEEDTAEYYVWVRDAHRNDLEVRRINLEMGESTLKLRVTDMPF